MSNSSLSNSHAFRKDDDKHGGIASLDSLNIKLHSLKCIASQAVNDHPNDVHLFHTLSGVAELLHAACAQSDGLDPSRIAADFAAMMNKKKPKPKK